MRPLPLYCAQSFVETAQLMSASSDRLEKLKARQAALAAKVRREQQRLKSQERKADTRRKVILGALVLKAMDTDPQLAVKVSKLLATLKREDERALFDLAPLSKSDQDKTATDDDKNPAPDNAATPSPPVSNTAPETNQQDNTPQPKRSLLGSFTGNKK